MRSEVSLEGIPAFITPRLIHGSASHVTRSPSLAATFGKVEFTPRFWFTLSSLPSLSPFSLYWVSLLGGFPFIHLEGNFESPTCLLKLPPPPPKGLESQHQARPHKVKRLVASRGDVHARGLRNAGDRLLPSQECLQRPHEELGERLSTDR